MSLSPTSIYKYTQEDVSGIHEIILTPLYGDAVDLWLEAIRGTGYVWLSDPILPARTLDLGVEDVGGQGWDIFELGVIPANGGNFRFAYRRMWEDEPLYVLNVYVRPGDLR